MARSGGRKRQAFPGIVLLVGPRSRLRACLAGLGLNSCSSVTVTPVFELGRVAVRMHRSTIINQLKSCEARLNAVIFIGGRLRKRNSAKQALTQRYVHHACHEPGRNPKVRSFVPIAWL